MRQIVKSLVVLLVVFSTADAGAPKGLPVVKHLPLDGVPGVILKNRSNSEYFPASWLSN